MKICIFILLGYLLGAIPNGVWIGKKFQGKDIRQYGSKNAGATNAYRVLGPKYGLSVLACDVLKGFLSVCFAHLAGIYGTPLLIIGIVAILGHTLSIFLSFKGGKGVATSLGVFLYLMPKVMVILVLIFVVVVYFSKFISLGSIICSALLPVLTIFFPPGFMISQRAMTILTAFLGAYVIYKHRSNIGRIIKGNENKFHL